MREAETPTGMSEEGYKQAIENCVWAIYELSNQFHAEPGNDIEKVASLIGRGELYDKFGDQIEAIDNIVEVIIETYGYTEDEVEEDLTALFDEKFEEIVLSGLVTNFLKT